MRRWMMAAVLAAASLSALPVGALADDPYPAAPPPGGVAQDTPPKDCTRFNGFYGFYGNVWCTPEEQARWDKWEADRLRNVTGGANPTPL